MDAEYVGSVARTLAQRDRIRKMSEDVWDAEPGKSPVDISGITVCGKPIAGIDSVGLYERVQMVVNQAVLDALAIDIYRVTVDLLRAGVRV